MTTNPETNTPTSLFWESHLTQKLLPFSKILPSGSFAIASTSSMVAQGVVPPRIVEKGIRDIDIWITDTAWRVLLEQEGVQINSNYAEFESGGLDFCNVELEPDKKVRAFALDAIRNPVIVNGLPFVELSRVAVAKRMNGKFFDAELIENQLGK